MSSQESQNHTGIVMMIMVDQQSVVKEQRHIGCHFLLHLYYNKSINSNPKELKMTEAKLTLQDGEIYLNRNGDSIQVFFNEDIDARLNYPFVDNHGDVYTASGNYYLSLESCDLDLIEVQPKITLQHGKKYKNQPKTITNPHMKNIEIFDKSVAEFLDEQCLFKEESYDSEQGLSQIVLEKFRTFLFKDIEEKEVRRLQYEELKKEFGNS
jgi:hypothetical protein